MNVSIDTARFAFSSNAFTNHSLEYAVESIAKCGYGGIEILADAPHGNVLRENPEKISETAKLINKHKLKISNINANTAVYLAGSSAGSNCFEPSLSNLDEKVRRVRIDFTLWCIDFAVQVGAPMVSLTSGLLLDNIAKDRQISVFRQSLSEILSVAQSKKIRIGIESEPNLLIGTTQEAMEIIDHFNSPWLGLNFDVGHSVVAEENLKETISDYSSHFFNIHIEDIKNKEHFHLIPGEGDIDFKKLMDYLNDFGYNKFLTVELYTYSNIPLFAAEKAMAFFRNL
ncbi:sugar phosphate isomerase/epimerase [bacterium]|nr:sugar phosphate isomerase/epimerase [bacterium]